MTEYILRVEVVNTNKENMIIHEEYNTTQIHFGKDGNASVGLTGSRGKLVIQELIAEVKIGDVFDKEKDISEIPKVVLNFTDASSIDSLITVLQKVKEKMESPEFPMYCYAC